MHLKRWLTGIVAIPALVYIIGPGPGWLFQILIFFAFALGLHEFLSITTPRLPVLIRPLLFIFILLYIYIISNGPFNLILPIISICSITLLTIYLFADPSRRAGAADEIGKMILGLAYVGVPLSLLIVMTRHPRGKLWIFFLLCIIFFSDTGAFYIGRTLGRHKLYPSVSPGKTWEGAFGGLAGSLLGAVLFSLFFPIYKINWVLLLLAAGLCVAGQIGDLAESMLKRNYGIKDSGKILPGHGGVLDRIDSLLFSIPLLYIFLSWA